MGTIRKINEVEFKGTWSTKNKDRGIGAENNIAKTNFCKPMQLNFYHFQPFNKCTLAHREKMRRLYHRREETHSINKKVGTLSCICDNMRGKHSCFPTFWFTLTFFLFSRTFFFYDFTSYHPLPITFVHIPNPQKCTFLPQLILQPQQLISLHITFILHLRHPFAIARARLWDIVCGNDGTLRCEKRRRGQHWCLNATTRHFRPHIGN